MKAIYREKDIQQRIIHRLKIARGHLNKVITMAEDQTYCIDLIHQSQAVQSALKEIDNLLLDNHLKTCVVSQIRAGKEEAISEIMQVFEKQKK
jgi:DNA-binding FrmR family transcriptional regulator